MFSLWRLTTAQFEMNLLIQCSSLCLHQREERLVPEEHLTKASGWGQMVGSITNKLRCIELSNVALLFMTAGVLIVANALITRRLK